MATQIQLRRGNTTATGAFTGAVAEVTIDTDKKTLVVHDGSTAGGFALARESYLTSNAAIAQGAYDKANSANVLAQASFDFANTANIKVDSAFAFANIANIKVDAAFTKANAANVLAQASFDFANTANIKVDSAYAFANVANTIAQASFNFANTANIKVDSVFTFANTINVKVDSAYAFANVANTIAQAAFNFANTSNIKIDSAYAFANIANTTADASFVKANAANVLAQASFDRANNSLNVQSGGSVTGDVTVTGNLTVVGQTVYANTSTVVIADNILTLNAAIDQASAPTVNAGIEIDRGSSDNVSILWNETSDTWTFTNDGSNYLEIADAARLNSAFALANTANTTADASFTKANSANVFAQAAFNKANSVASLAFSTVSANGTSLVAAANNDTLTIAGANGVGVTGNATTDTFTINLTPTGVTSGTYGDSSTTVTLTVDAQGRITSISQTALTFTETDPNALAFAIALG